MKHYATSLAALALAAALAGCAPFAPLSQSSSMVQNQTAAVMDDGVLRFLYAANTNGGGTLLRGDEVLYRAAPSQKITLVNDPATGLPVAWELETNENSTTRVTEVYSPDGSLLWSGEGEWQAAMAGHLLALQPGTQMEAGPASEPGCRLIDLTNGTEISLPADTTGCIPTTEDQVVLTITTQEDSPNLENSSVVVQTLDGQELLRLDRAYAYQSYGYEGENSCINIQQYQPDTGLWVNSLYDPATRECISNFYGFCGPDVICFQQADGRYAVRTLEDSTPLAVYDGGCAYWNNGMALISMPQDDSCILYLADGTSRPLYSFLSYTSDAVSSSFLFADGTLLLCGEDGTITYLEPDLHGAAQASLYSAEGGYVILALSDEDYNTIAYQIYDASGLLYDSSSPGARHFYTRIYYLTTADGTTLYQAAYDGPGGSTLYDVLDAHGNVVLSGLADLAASSLFNLPDGVFGARQGFERGFMDAAGQWVYSESLFTSLSADDSFDYL